MLEFKKRPLPTFMDPREGFARKSITRKFALIPTGESGRLAHLVLLKHKRLISPPEYPAARKYCPSVRKILKQQHPGFPGNLAGRFSAERRSKGYTEHLSL